MKSIAALVFGLSLMTLASVTYGDWQYTKWGMSSSQVVEASKGVAIPPPATEKGNEVIKPLLQATYSSGTLNFTATFFFDTKTHGLSTIRLSLLDSTKCNELHDLLQIRYGSPARYSSSKMTTDIIWRDSRESNTVRLLVIRDIG